MTMDSSPALERFVDTQIALGGVRMTQGKKRGARFSQDFKSKALKRIIAGEKQAEIAADLKMSESSLNNWVKLFRAGKIDENGHALAATKRVSRKGKKLGKRKPKEQPEARTAKPKPLAVQTTPRNITAMQVQITRLEKELAYVKADRDILVTALASLTK